MTRLSAAGLLAIAGVLACGAPQASTKPSPSPATAATGAKPDSAAKAPKPKIKQLKDLITDKAKADSGLFIVYAQGDSTFFSIPDSMLGRQMLLVSRIARTATNIGYGGEETNETVVRWERR